MKKNRLAALAAVLTAAVSAFSFAACSEKEAGELNLNPCDEITTTYVKTVFENTQESSLNTGEMSVSLTVNGSSSSFLSDEYGNLPAGTEKQEISSEQIGLNVEVSALFSGEGDMDMQADFTVTGESAAEGKVFAWLRDEYTFWYMSEGGEDSDLSEAVISVIDLSDVIGQITGITLPEIQAEDAVELNTVPTLALSYGAVSCDDGIITVDFNKALASLVKDFLQTVNGLNEKTTVGSLASSRLAKNIIDAFFGDCSATEFYEEVLGALTLISPESAAYIKAIIPPPAETDQTVSDYIMTILNDERFSSIILTQLNVKGKTLATVTLADLIGKEQIEQIKAKVNECVKMEYENGALTLKLNFNGNSATVKVGQCRATFKVDPNNCITSVVMTCSELSLTLSSVGYDYVEDGYVCTQTALTGGIEIAVNLKSDGILADISGVQTDYGITVGELIASDKQN